MYDSLPPPVAVGHAKRLRGCRSRVASATSSVPKTVCSLLGTLGRPEPLAVAVHGFGRAKRRLAAIVTASGQRAYASIPCAGSLGDGPVRPPGLPLPVRLQALRWSAPEPAALGQSAWPARRRCAAARADVLPPLAARRSRHGPRASALDASGRHANNMLFSICF